MEHKCVFGVNIRSGVDKALVFVRSASFFKDVLYALGSITYSLRGARLSTIKIYSPSNDDARAGRNYFIIARVVDFFLLSHTSSEKRRCIDDLEKIHRLLPSN